MTARWGSAGLPVIGDRALKERQAWCARVDAVGCTVCGCLLENKLIWATETCPKGK